MNEEQLEYIFKHTKKVNLIFSKNLFSEDLDVLSGKVINVLYYISQLLDSDGNYASDFNNMLVAHKAKVNLKTVSIYIRRLVDSGFMIKNKDYHHYYTLNADKIEVK